MTAAWMTTGSAVALVLFSTALIVAGYPALCEATALLLLRMAKRLRRHAAAARMRQIAHDERMRARWTAESQRVLLMEHREHI